MKIRMTFDLGPEERRAIAYHYGEPGRASWSTCKQWIATTVGATLQEIGGDEQREQEYEADLKARVEE